MTSSTASPMLRAHPRRKRWRRRVAQLLFVLSWVFALAARAAADPSCVGWAEDFGGEQDGLVLDCEPGFATQHDRITIHGRYPYLADATWRFDVGATGDACLLAEFRAEDGRLIAELYDDQDGDRRVSHVIEEGSVRVTEPASLSRRVRQVELGRRGAWALRLQEPSRSGRASDGHRWTVRVTALAGEWVDKNGSANMNLDMAVDGPVVATFGTQLFIDRLSSDGEVDFDIKVRDADGDGLPDYEIRQAYPDVPESWDVYRTIVNVAARPDHLPLTGAVFWPLLAAGRDPVAQVSGGSALATSDLGGGTWGYARDYGSRHPPIQVDWNRCVILYIGELTPSRAGEGNWFVHSVSRFGEDDRKSANFENPFAFYDLAADRDGYPELQIRSEYTFASQRIRNHLPLGQPTEVVRYSWDQDNDRSWDFKLDLLGRHLLERDVRFPEFAIRTVPYEELPRWVLERSWDAAALVADESGEYWTSEGIYEWSSTQLRDQYVAGVDPATVALPQYRKIGRGLRGEVAPALHGRPRLYVSPIDHKVHLLGATSGVWNLGHGRRLRYASLSGRHIQRWVLTEYGRQVATLHAVAGQLVYADGAGVKLARSRGQPLLLEGAPPRDPEEWRLLGELLRRHAAPFPGDDLAAMIEQFDAVHSIAGASVRHFRVVPDGFRFVLELPSAAAQHVAWLAGVGGGSHVVTYAKGRYAVGPWIRTPPTLDVPRLADRDAGALATHAITAAIANRGTADLEGVSVVFSARREGGSPSVIGSAMVDVCAGETTTAHIRWVPPEPGDWTVEVEADGQRTSAVVHIPSAPQLRLGALLRSGSGRAVASVPLLALLPIAGVLLWRCALGGTGAPVRRGGTR